MIIIKDFYNRSALDVAQDLLGKVLVREVDGKILKGKIVETEAYIGSIDKACHAYNGRRTKRTEILYEDPGVSYIYFIYGAIEPINELDYISNIRYNKKYDELTRAQSKNLTNGPSKLCLAYLLNKDLNAIKLYEKGAVYITDDNNEDFEIVESKRIGIDYAEEAKDFLWRFYIKDNIYVSKK